ncbi:hypothetical protein OZD68_04455 [Wolbachia endosymbiont of Drosophila bicornuta]|uniref:hypothetical protein n=1 Tax=Wolbachia TaxID=953 RepID=UPI0015FD21C1|nr:MULTISPECIES: hypothetical protein [Wolbachia]MBA8755496.1 hypothetical protein [Wolbachia pipientis]MDE5056824.1 hypothetical protein [Wolbachia endosymbiont of Drosophila bicornuta]
MVAILNVTKGKNKVIVSGLAGALSALIFLTAIHIAAKIAIIVSAAAVTYLLLSLVHKIRTKAEITRVSGDKVSEDEGYSSVDEGEEKDTVKEPKRTETEREEEIIRKRAQERMEKGSLGGPINAFGEPIHVTIDAENSNPVDYTKTMVVPEEIILSMLNDKTLTQNNSSSIKNQMKPLPEHTDVPGNPLPGQVLSNLELESKSTQKLSALDLLLQCKNVDNDVKKMLKQPITQKGFNGLGFDR